MKLLVTGASGFLGRHIVAQAVLCGHEARAQVRPVADVSELGWEDHPSVEVVRADLRSSKGLEDIVRGVDVVVSNAACKAGDFYTQFAGTVITTENLLAAMARVDVKRLVAVSTFSVYGFLRLRDGELLDEESAIDDDPIDRDEYAQTKILQEELVWEFAREQGGEVTVVRPGVIYGRDNLWTARIGAELGGRRCLVVGGRTILPLTYVENCAQAVVLAAEKEQAIGQVYNVVDDDLPTHGEYLRALNRNASPATKSLPIPWLAMRGLAAFGLGVNKLFLGRRAKVPSILRPASLHARCKPSRYSNRRIKTALGWSPRYGLEEALARSVAEKDQAALSTASVDESAGGGADPEGEPRSCA